MGEDIHSANAMHVTGLVQACPAEGSGDNAQH